MKEAFVIVNTETWRHMGTYYTTLRRAIGGAKKLGIWKEPYEAMTYDHWKEMDALYKVTVKNLMTGLPVEIRLSDAGTCCDPSTERYWSM